MLHQSPLLFPRGLLQVVELVVCAAHRGIGQSHAHRGKAASKETDLEDPAIPKIGATCMLMDHKGEKCHAPEEIASEA